MLVDLLGPSIIWRTVTSLNNWNLLWQSSRLIFWSEPKIIYTRTFRHEISVYFSTNAILDFKCHHREHTILLSRERVNKRTKRMTEQSTFVSCSHLFYLTRFYWENRWLQILRNTVALNLYLGLSALSKNFLGLYKIWQGRQLFAKTFWTHCKYSLESLNFVAFTKPNKHKMSSEGFSTTWPNLFSSTFAIVGEF